MVKHQFSQEAVNTGLFFIIGETATLDTWLKNKNLCLSTINEYNNGTSKR